MDLGIKGAWYVVTGSTSGLGKAIASRLIGEGATVVLNGRNEENLLALHQSFPSQTVMLPGDITTDAVISTLVRLVQDKPLKGIVLNASGPPAGSFFETDIYDWDKAYENLLRWKVKLIREVVEPLLLNKDGRILFVESVSVRQPVASLVLSNSLRMAVVGFAKTLALELASQGITVNVLAPGYHATPAMERLYQHKAMLLGISPDEAKADYINESKTGHLGDPDDFASLAAWLLSPHGRYVTGQTIVVDGGLSVGHD